MRSESKRSINLVDFGQKIKKKNYGYQENNTFSQMVNIVNNILIDNYNDRIERKRIPILIPRVRGIVDQQRFNIPGVSTESLVESITEALTGYENIHHLVANKEVKNIVVQDFKRTWIMQGLKWRPVSINFNSPSELNRYISRVVSRLGGRYTMANPLAKIEDDDFNLRIRAAGYDISPDSPKLFIRRLSKDILNPNEIRYSMSQPIEDFLKFCIRSGFNIGVTGTYGSGKTSLLGTMSSWIQSNKHVTLIQSSNEIQLVHPFMTRLMTRELVGEQGNVVREIDLLDFSKQTNSNVICLGEFLDEAAYTYLHVLQQGVMSLCTYHANDPAGAVNSFIYMVNRANQTMYDNDELIRQSAMYNDILVVMDRLKVREIVQFTGEVRSGQPVYEPIWKFNVSEETNYELKGTWSKVNGASLCEKLKRKAQLSGVSIPSEYLETLVISS